MNRSTVLEGLNEDGLLLDVVVIGGGATGLGIALDAVTRGYSVALLEKVDFAKGTSSRSTKLLHGGVRYLAQGNVRLVLEALKERGRIMKNAEPIVSNRLFAVPLYQWWEVPFYYVGLKLYDILAGKLSLGKSSYISREKLIQKMPNIKQKGLKGGILYRDGQFDDAELAVSIAQTAAEQGAFMLNHSPVTSIDKVGNLFEIGFQDALTGQSFRVKSKTVFNATGVFVDYILKMENKDVRSMIAPSQGIHLVVDQSFLPSDLALMIPKTSDGRVLFGVQWQNKLLLGTTDSPVKGAEFEPKAMESEIQFVLDTASSYLANPPHRSDVKSIFAGLRPLVAPEGKKSTKEISRGHKILVSNQKMITIIGGKWTTYRKMAEDAVDRAIRLKLIPNRECKTYELNLVGKKETLFQKIALEQESRRNLLHSQYTYSEADVVYAIRHEMACTIEDVLARRVRLLFLDAQVAQSIAPRIAEILREELGTTYDMEKDLIAFHSICKYYLIENFNFSH